MVFLNTVHQKLMFSSSEHNVFIVSSAHKIDRWRLVSSSSDARVVGMLPPLLVILRFEILDFRAISVISMSNFSCTCVSRVASFSLPTRLRT